MRRGLNSNTSIGSVAPANSAKSPESPMSRNHAKIWENRLETGGLSGRLALGLIVTVRQFLPHCCRCEFRDKMGACVV